MAFSFQRIFKLISMGHIKLIKICVVYFLSYCNFPLL